MAAWKTKTKYENMDIVLIISQDLEMVAVWKTLFQQKNCQVITETVASDALQTANLLAPELIILNLNLPQAEQIDLCRELRLTTNGTLLLLAPKEGRQKIPNYYHAGVNEHLTTPINPMTLLIKSMAWLVRQE
jgi:DNA-binding response OmpR family regulator